jgi:inhibitor of KinA
MMLYLTNVIDISLAPIIGRITQRIKKECADILELTPSYTSILIETNPLAVELEKLEGGIMSIAQEEITRSLENENPQSGKLIELPVYYHRDVGPDIDSVAEKSGLLVEELISIHSGRDYTVCAIGFAPGFAFLAEVDERINHPRHKRPRAIVPGGSVGIAEKQTAVYPSETPGGWQIIGNCPIPLYHPNKKQLSPFEIGDQVRFVPTDRKTYIQLGGHV